MSQQRKTCKKCLGLGHLYQKCFEKRDVCGWSTNVGKLIREIDELSDLHDVDKDKWIDALEKPENEGFEKNHHRFVLMEMILKEEPKFFQQIPILVFLKMSFSDNLYWIGQIAGRQLRVEIRRSFKREISKVEKVKRKTKKNCGTKVKNKAVKPSEIVGANCKSNSTKEIVGKKKIPKRRDSDKNKESEDVQEDTVEEEKINEEKKENLQNTGEKKPIAKKSSQDKGNLIVANKMNEMISQCKSLIQRCISVKGKQEDSQQRLEEFFKGMGRIEEVLIVCREIKSEIENLRSEIVNLKGIIEKGVKDHDDDTSEGNELKQDKTAGNQDIKK